jgi:hypothetical protein
MPYAIYNVGDIVKDKCILYKVTLPVTRSEDNIASPEFSQYFTAYLPVEFIVPPSSSSSS